MKENYKEYWDKCWNLEDQEELKKYLGYYYKKTNWIIDVFKQNGIKSVCDAACGFGAYTIMLKSNGFDVASFDISERAVCYTKKALKNYGYDYSDVITSSITNIDYPDNYFDGVIAHAVLDHLTLSDCRKAIVELFRIVKSRGLVAISFDIPSEDDYSETHIMLDDGTMLYQGNDRDGMLFRPYTKEMIDELFVDYTIMDVKEIVGREYLVILRND